MKAVWFKSWGWIYRPISWQGILIVLLGLAFCIQIFFAVDQNSHSVSDTLYGIFPYIVPALMLLNWVASKTSKV
jgi:phosphoglycerol transferase MdoB-like AlkP superfamily enzyme